MKKLNRHASVRIYGQATVNIVFVEVFTETMKNSRCKHIVDHLNTPNFHTTRLNNLNGLSNLLKYKTSTLLLNYQHHNLQSVIYAM